MSLITATKHQPWNHPKEPTKDSHPQLFSHSLGLTELLTTLEKTDMNIVDKFKLLGMSDALSDEPLFQVGI